VPANLPPQYFAAQKRFQTAKTCCEKMQALEEMLAIMPHHKGTERLRADLTGRIAKLSEEAEKRSGTGRKGYGYYVRKEGAGQVAVVGLPNVGKSQLVAALTGVHVEVADYPFTTKTVTPAMMEFENIQIQLLDMPPLTDRSAQEWLSTVVSNADLLLILADLSADPVHQLAITLQELETFRIGLQGWEIEREPTITYVKKALVVGSKSDLDPSTKGFEALREHCGDCFPIIVVSAARGNNLEELRKAVFDALEIIRVYTKAPGQRADLAKPFVVGKGATVDDIAALVHKDLLMKLRYAQVWGSGKFDAQRVGRDHVLLDGDVVELHS
jgi:ribosome-interacting GTPase 1